MKKDEYSILRNTVYNAGSNLMRKKGEPVIPLFNEEVSGDEVSDKEKAQKEREELFGRDAE